MPGAAVNGKSSARTSSKKKSLAEELAELANPAPLVRDEDPEESQGFGLEAKRLYSADDDDEDLFAPTTTPSARQRKERGLLLRGALEVEGVEYAGRPSSRRDALGADDSDAEEASTDGEGGDASAAAAVGSAARRARKGPRVSEEEEESDNDEDEGDDDDDDDDMMMAGGEGSDHARRAAAAAAAVGGGGEGEGGEEDAEMEALDREYRAMRHQEEEMVKSVHKAAGADHAKGLSVARQKALWERALELRIGAQKPLASACRLPHPIARQQLCDANAEVADGYASVAASAKAALDALLSLLEALEHNNGAIAAAAATSSDGGSSGKRKRDDTAEEVGGGSAAAMWQHLDETHARLAPYCGSAVDRWQRKTLLLSGAAAAKGRLRALNQSVTQQVAGALRDPTRLVARTRLRPSVANILGQKLLHSAAGPEGRTATEDAVGNAEQETGSFILEEEGDPETFDDTDFYQQLLREFLETSDPDALGGMSLYATRKLRNNKKKTVDRRASKGRKLRYTVHPQLVNYMAPEPMNLPPMADKLFRTLFGQQPKQSLVA